MAQQLSSIQAFQKMMPVFRSPRCANCHGGITSPLASNNAIDHMGVVRLSAADGPKACAECHMDGWITAPSAAWSRSNDFAICREMKRRFTSAEFIDHIIRDGGGPQFIEAGFKGMRGLTDGGQSIVEDELGTIVPAPPPGTHAQLVQQARDWVKAQGGSFAGDADCGCSLDQLSVSFFSIISVQQNGVTRGSSQVKASLNAVVYLGPDPGEPAYAATTGPEELGDATMRYPAAEVTRENCVVTIQSNPETDAAIWVGIVLKPEVKVSLQLAPATDLHPSQTRCKDPRTGRVVTVEPEDQYPGLFSAAWSALYGKGVGASTPADTASPMNPMNMDMTRLQAMAEKMKSASPNAATGAQMAEMMKMVVPNGQAMMEAARSNFMLTMPNEWCKPDGEYLMRCTINRTVTVPSPLGGTQTISENTTIKIGRS